MNIELQCGDCLQLMQSIPDASVDMVLTDPPYGINYQSHRRRRQQDRFGVIAGDGSPNFQFIGALKRMLKPSGCVAIFTRWDTMGALYTAMETAGGIKPNSCVLWDKEIHGMGDLKKAFAPTHELFLFHAEDQFKFQRKRPCDVIHCRKVLSGKLVHPNEKPVGLMETIILDCVPYGGTVLDIFMGLGTTGVAAVNTGRNFIGMELNPEYWQIAEARIAEALQKANGIPQKSTKTKGGQMDVFDLLEENE